MEVLDTAALLAWPLDRLRDAVFAAGQQAEVARLAPSRAMLFEAQGLVFQSPVSLEGATAAARETGDLPALSEVDLALIALAFELDLPLVTDDYRMQNVCAHRGHPWRPVLQSGVTEVRQHSLDCTGCGARDVGAENCPDCGGATRLRKA